MKQPVRSVINIGSQGLLVEIECNISNGLPAIIIVGLGGKAVDEAKERIRAAFASCKLPLPRKRIAINLAPADIRKESTSLDLAIAAAILSTSEQIKYSLSDFEAAIGEIGLDGTIRAVRGIIGKIITGQALGITTFYIPERNLQQASLITGVTLLPLTSISQLHDHLTGRRPLTPHASQEPPKVSVNSPGRASLMHVIGQEKAKRALEIAAAGGHNIFLSGPPGTGKSMLAKILPQLLPAMSRSEMLAVTQLHSLANNDYDRLVTERPFRAPHHSASHVSLVGGGHSLRPGEISLGHRGVLFMDEMPEFARNSLEALRQPLEDRMITVARAKDVAEFPANFILIATANPCPCGYYGTDKQCICPPHAILRYRQKISGPIMDRFDLYVESEAVDHKLLLNSESDTNQDEIVRQRIANARTMQYQRLQGDERLNSDLSNKELAVHAQIGSPALTLLNQAAKRLDLSARGYMRVLKVARTLADLDQSAKVTIEHISEALQYRRPYLPTIY